MEQLRMSPRSLLGAAVGLLLAGLSIATPAAAQTSRAEAEQLCTPDVMRLCNEFIPDPNRILRCLNAKRRQLSPGCRTAMSGGGKGKTSKRKRVATKRR